MKWLLAGVIGVALAGPSAAQDASQFDLVCEGTEQTELDGPVEPHRYGFRVDLAANRWCWQACEVTFAIQEVAPERLIFKIDQQRTSRRESSFRNEISRTTGVHQMVSIEAAPLQRYHRVTGICRPAPFSGFPTGLF